MCVGEQKRYLVGDLFGGHSECLVNMHIALRDATCRVAKQGSDRQFREAEIAGYAGECVAQRVRSHVR